jgi:hypothetical protein
MKWQSIFVTVLLMSHATQSLSAGDAWDCDRERGENASWTCVANSSLLVEPKTVSTQLSEGLEEPLLKTGFAEKDLGYDLLTTPVARTTGLSVWLENIPINHHVIQFGAFLSLANANVLVESSSLSQDLRIIPLQTKGAVTYVVISETSFMYKDGIAIAESFFDNNTDVRFWLRTPQSLAKLAILD